MMVLTALTEPTRTTSANRFLPQLADRTQLSLCLVAIGVSTFSNGDANRKFALPNLMNVFIYNGFEARLFFLQREATVAR
jgi:glutaminase